MKAYKIIFPENYVKPVMLLDIPWIKELRNTENKQGKSLLRDTGGRECCLGLASRLQGRLIESLAREGNVCENIHVWRDGESGETACLNWDNPLMDVFSKLGSFPKEALVEVCEDGSVHQYECLAKCNDEGLTFPQIADIILEIWDVRYTNPEHQH